MIMNLSEINENLKVHITFASPLTNVEGGFGRLQLGVRKSVFATQP